MLTYNLSEESGAFPDEEPDMVLNSKEVLLQT